MNPKLTITVDVKNRALSVASGMIAVGAKIDVEISGLPGDIPPWGESDAFSGPSARFRLVDECGRDLARYPLADGDGWEQSGGVLSSITPVEFDTDRLRRAFRGVAFDDTLPFGVIVDSAVDAAQYAVGRVKVRQWAAASTEDPTVLPDWRETLDRLQKDLADVSKKRDDAVAAKAAAVSAASEAQSSMNAAAASASSALAAKNEAVAARDRAESASGDFDKRLKDYAKKEEVRSGLSLKADLVDGKVPANQLPAVDQNTISDADGSVIRADGSAVVIDGSWTCNGVLLTKKEGRDDYWENAERHWGLGYIGDSRWALAVEAGQASTTAPADATSLSFVIGGVTYDATIGRADSVVMAGDVVPVGDGTETIATICGKDIKAPAVPVSSVNGKKGEVKLVAADVGALPLAGGTLTGDLVIGDKEHPASRKLTVEADGGANGIQLTGGNVNSGSSMTIGGSSGNGGALVVEDGGSGNASIKKGGKEVATEEQLTPISAQSAYPMSTVVDGSLKDRTVNHATAGGTFTFPERTGTNARDFVLVIDALSEAPTVTFPGSVTYVSEQDAADVWTAEADKVNAWYFSEQTDGVFMVCHKAMGVVSQ